MDGLYNRVYNGNDQCLGPLLNTTPFRSPTSGGLNRSFKIRNNTSSNIYILMKDGEFLSLAEAKDNIKDSIYRYDNYFCIKPFSMNCLQTSTYSFYILCYVFVNSTRVILFEEVTNRFTHIVITEEMLLEKIDKEPKNIYIDYLKQELQKTRNLERQQTKSLILNNNNNFKKKDYIDFTRSDRGIIKHCMSSLLKHSYMN